jgi:hypothetical protein
MKILPAFILLIVLVISACNTQRPKTAVAIAAADTSKFYPLRSFFKEQIEYVDLRNFLIYRITVKDGKKDSATLTKDAFIAMAGVFLQHDISDPKIKALYKETVFHDLSTGSITLNYTPTDSKAEVQNVDILLDDETNIVKRVFIRSVYTKGDTTITEQCNWKANKSFQLNRERTTKNGYTATELNYINWNDKPQRAGL